MRVLIIDDEESIRQTMSVLLEGLGHESVCAGNRSAALKQLDRGVFDLAFLDLKLDLASESGLLRQRTVSRCLIGVSIL